MSNDADQSVTARALRRGVLFGLGAGVIAGGVWYLVVIGTSSTQSYLMPAFGVAVSFGVFAGMHRPGLSAAIVSVVITAVALLVAMYYVERHLVVKFFTDNRDAIHIPLVPYLDWLAAVLRRALTKSPSAPVYSVLALVAAGWFGHQGFESRDPIAWRG